MRTKIHQAALLLAMLAGLCLHAQDFSNKGKDFWVGYGNHVRFLTPSPLNGQEMVLYFATDVATNVTVQIPAVGYSASYSIPANTIFTSNPLPKSGSQDARLLSEGIIDRGIHITSDQPIVAYAHIYNGSISGATILFPTNTLGKEYYSINYKQVSNEDNSNCWFYAIAVDTGTTTVQITPSGNTINHAAGVPFTVNLTQGQVINIMGKLTSTSNPFTGVDLTGSTIKSISNGNTGCKRIAVFSGSAKLSITCTNGSGSADNYMVQAFPKTAWGKKYLTVPTRNLPFNFFRICVSDPSTVVKLNGSVLASSSLVNGFYYEINTTMPTLIEGDKPILVAQYITTQGACNNGSPGDPEVIYLSPVEQNIDRVILNSTANYAITQHFINVVIKGSAVGSFKVDGNSYSSFASHPQDGNYAYAQIPVSAGQHTLQADSGFNAVAYGYGSAESYGYNAGTNVRDLYQFVSIKNQYATVSFPAACKSSPFYFSMTFPYQPTQIQWDFGGLFPNVTVGSPTPDSSWVVNGKQLYQYRLPNPFTINTIGTYPIKVLAENPTPDGCSGLQEIDYDLQVFERPAADFTINATGCLADSVRLTDNTNTNGRPAIKWNWNFDDGTGSAVKNPVHLYNAPNTYTIKYSTITDIGCLSDTISKTIAITSPAIAKFGVSAPFCIGSGIVFTDSSAAVNSPIAKWYWDFGDGTQTTATANGAQVHRYSKSGTYTTTLKVETAAGCLSTLYSKDITIHEVPVADFTFGNACLPNAAMQFTDRSTIADGTQNQFTYIWDMGDGAQEFMANPLHTYIGTGPYKVFLRVKSNNGCISDTAKMVNTIYAQPQAAFNAQTEICLGGSINFTDQSQVPNSIARQWYWDFGDGTTDTTQNPVHKFAKAGTYSVTFKLVSAIGCVSTVATKDITVNPLPKAIYTVSTPDCVNGMLTFTSNSVANAGVINQWDWDFGDGAVLHATTGGNQTHSFSNTGNYSTTLAVKTDKGCVDTFRNTLVIHPLPVPDFSLPDNCPADPYSIFNDSTRISGTGESIATYLWSYGDPNAAGNTNTSNATPGKHRYAVAGNYNVSLTVTSNYGCTASITKPFTLNGALPQAAFSLPNAQVCSNDTFYIINNSTVSPGRIVKLEVYWDFANDPTNKTIYQYPNAGASFGHLYPALYSPSTKTYSIKVFAYSGDNCVDAAATQTVTIKAIPKIQFGVLNPVCANDPAYQLNASVSNLSGTGLYSGTTGLTAAGLLTPQKSGAGLYTIQYQFTATNGCIDTASQPLRIYPVPTVNAGPDQFVLEGGSGILAGSGAGNNVTYLWSPSTWLDNVRIAQPTTTPTNDITYMLTVTSADGCKDSDMVFVKVLKAPTIPNTFSPNGDGIHDTWEIKYLDSYPDCTVEIYNRYGQLLFESKGYGKPWDGTFKGSPLPVGTYYYIINPKHGRNKMAGFVDIIR